MDNRTVLRHFVLVFVVTFAGIFVLLRSDLVGHFAYLVEKGRLRAIRESLPSAEELAARSIPARQVARLVSPAVVYIETESLLSLSLGRERAASPEDGPPPDGEEGGREDYRLPGWGPWRMTGVGSGFVIDAETGYVLTNHHVIEGAEVIRVQLADGRRYQARVVGSDPETDLAVIAVEADRLHQVPFGDSDAVEVGDDVFALGNPFGLAGTVSRGIVSAKGRSNVAIGDIVYKGFLQTDAAINPGNSGGPLVNMRGEVIGVNTAIATQTGRYDGVGFAIPSSRVRDLLPKLAAGQRVVRGFLGIVPVSVNDFAEVAAQLGWKEPYGALVARVEQDTGAEAAGLQEEDIIIEIDGTRLEDKDQLMELVGAQAPGTVLTLRIWRDGGIITRQATLGQRPTP